MAIKAGQLKERADYQAYILEMLREKNGYQVRPSTAYDPGYGMDVERLFSFLEETQPDALVRLEKLYGDKTRQTILNYINNEVNKKNRSLLDVLKHGVEFDNGVSLTLMYRKPATTFNQKAEALYQQNVLSVMEEVCHKEDERIDLVIFLNGIAIFTFELKCNTSGQNYEDAIRQYKFERDYKTRLLKFKAGCLAHFAMDLNEVYMCTNLKGKSSFFLPFNKGCGVGIHSGKGNPHNENGINVSYMWEDILKKDTVLYLIDKIIFLQKDTKKDPDTGKRVTKETLIFPRYHQFNAVRKLVADVVEHHSEKNYLIEHSAGSGKTNDYKLVEQDDYLLVDGLHEGIVSEELWNEAQVKLLAQAKKYEKVNHGKDNKIHLLSGIVKCPICGAGMYGNKSIKHKADGTKYKDFFYYGCKHRTMTHGHKCDYKKQINEELLDDAVAEVLVKLVSNPKFATMLQEKINMKVDTTAIEQEIANYEKQLRQSYSVKARLMEEIDSLDPDDKHYYKRKTDLDDRLYKMYDKIEDTENLLIVARAKKMAIEAEKLTGDNIYKVLIYFEKLYAVMNEQEKRQLMETLISEIQIYPERQPNGQWLKSIKFKLPIIEEDMNISLDNDTHIETVCLLSKLKY